MANKFSKSIMERLEQETYQQEKAEKKDVMIIPDIPPIAIPVIENTAPIIQNPKKEPKAIAPDLSSYLRNDIRRQAKNKTFYLDEDLLGTLKQAAKQQGVAESRLVNDILRKVLNI
jgi:hypothetical protein